MEMCPECKKPVSIEAVTCPHCGKPLAEFFKQYTGWRDSDLGSYQRLFVDSMWWKKRKLDKSDWNIIIFSLIGLIIGLYAMQAVKFAGIIILFVCMFFIGLIGYFKVEQFRDVRYITAIEELLRYGNAHPDGFKGMHSATYDLIKHYIRSSKILFDSDDETDLLTIATYPLCEAKQEALKRFIPSAVVLAP